MCYDKIKSGQINEPACTSACPTKATIYGKREELLELARSRIRRNPDMYLNHIYGEKEVGGTCVMYITSKDCPLDFLHYYEHRHRKDVKLVGLPDITEPLPNTTKWAMTSVPFAFLGMGSIMTGAYWIIKRRQMLMKNNHEDIEDGEN
jgi:formate dehydrogenase iron-sulfur subunit